MSFIDKYEQEKLVVEAKLIVSRDAEEYDILTRCRLSLEGILIELNKM